LPKRALTPYRVFWSKTRLGLAGSSSQHAKMPRPPRTAPSGVPLHIVQRGNNKKPCFLGSPDYCNYLRALATSSKRYEVDIHAYALMTNHVHLLATPRENMSASRMVQQLGREYVQEFNRVHSRSGTLWEGRYRSSPILTDRYLLACYRYIELNPVNAGMVDSPELYRWSSYKTNALGKPNCLIQPHSTWLALGHCDQDRRMAYRHLFSFGNTAAENAQIRMAYRKGRPVGE